MEGNHDFYRNDGPHQRDGYYMTHLITDEAVEWINIQKEDQPFFLYVPYTTPHAPYQGPDDYQPEKLGMDRWNKAEGDVYTKMIEDMDRGIGKILDKLEEKGMSENTIVIFFSDNGPNKLGNTGPYSGNKGHVYEGGIRVPCIIRWPGKIQEGSTSDQAFISMDLTASIVAISGATPQKPLDGIDLIGHLVSGKENESRNLFWRKKRAEQVYSAIRSGYLKFIRDEDEGKFEEYLFDLKADPGEKHNLKAERPEDFKRLKQLLSAWEKEVKPERYRQ
jgi:N-acetylgalactosamine-6-sulfatase